MVLHRCASIVHNTHERKKNQFDQIDFVRIVFRGNFAEMCRSAIGRQIEKINDPYSGKYVVE